jgi:hypothetical protein
VTILTAQAWASNAELIADVAKLGYLGGTVLDVTYGLGTFWKVYQPAIFRGTDIDSSKSRSGCSVDFRSLPFGDRSYDTVVIDPPYKLNGTPDPTVDARYGVHVAATWQDRMELMLQGLRECLRVSRQFVLMKCMDQVCSGKKRWQTFSCIAEAHRVGAELVDRFDMLVTPRQQPPGRRQIHTQGNYSTLLIFEKGRK